MRIGFSAQDGLDGFGTDSPATLQVAANSLLVENKLAQTLQGTLDADEHVSHRHTDVAEHSAVGEVALQTADRQLLTEVRQDSIGDAQIALRVLEVDGINLVRHSARTYLAGLNFLTEVLHRDILPEIAV